MLKLIKIEREGETDQVLMVVPEDYDMKLVLKECRLIFSDTPEITLEVPLPPEVTEEEISLYRPFVG